MQPHYIFLPGERCKLFDLWVQFDRENLPRQARQLSEVFQNDIDDQGSRARNWNWRGG
jgi:hypothetical protein